MDRWRDDAPRSWLFVPATRAVELLGKALASEADAVIVDLETAVPAADKDRGRTAATRALAGAKRSVPVFARVNASPQALLAADLAAVVAARFDGLILPMVANPNDVRRLCALLDASAQGGRDSRLPIVALVETATGVLNAAAIAEADDRVV